MKKRIEYYDIAKGILIFLMVFAHIFQSGYLHDFIYTFHMPAFFIITGMLFNYSSVLNKSFAKFLQTRIHTLVIPLLFFELIGIAMFIYKYGNTQNVKGYIYNIIMWHFNNGVNWFLATLFVGEILFFFLVKYIKTKKGCMIVAILLFGISMLWNGIDITFIMNIRRILLCIALMMLGYQFYKGFADFRWYCIAISLVLVVGVTLINGTIGVDVMRLNNPLLFLIGACSGTYIIIQLAKVIKSKFISAVGENSLIVFGTHNALYVSVGNAMGIYDFTYTPYIKGILLFCIVILLEVPIIYLLNRYFFFLIGKQSSIKNTFLR